MTGRGGAHGVLSVLVWWQNLDGISKTAQVGTVIEGPLEFKSGRLSRKQRKTNLVDEILADRSIRSVTSCLMLQ